MSRVTLGAALLAGLLVSLSTAVGGCRPRGDEPPGDRPYLPPESREHDYLPQSELLPHILEEFHAFDRLPGAYRPQFDLTDLFRRICLSTLGQPGPLEARLSECGRLRSAIVWETAGGEPVPYDGWTATQKDRLDALFQALARGDADLGLSCPDPATSYSLRPAPDGGRTIFFTADQAFDVFAAHVAHALHLEATEAVPWSLYRLPGAELAELLSSDRYHSRILPSTRDDPSDPYYPSHIRPGRDFQLTYQAYGVTGRALNCDPRIGYRFVRGASSTSGEDLVAGSETQTLARLGRWLADNVAHGGHPEDFTAENRLRHSYLDGRLRAQFRDHGWTSYTLVIAVHGCHSASNLLHDLARSINVPLLRIFTYDTGAHQGLAFRWTRRDPRFLHHLDDLYAVEMNLAFPLDGRGAVPDAATAERLVFDAHWSPPARLGRAGFALTGDYSILPAPPRPSFDHPNTGAVGGAWHSLEAAREYDLEQRYRLGSWGRYLRFYCASVSSFDFEIGRRRIATSRPLAEHRDRAAAIVAAYPGGCDALAAQADDYPVGVRGSSTWRD